MENIFQFLSHFSSSLDFVFSFRIFFFINEYICIYICMYICMYTNTYLRTIYIIFCSCCVWAGFIFCFLFSYSCRAGTLIMPHNMTKYNRCVNNLRELASSVFCSPHSLSINYSFSIEVMLVTTIRRCSMKARNNLQCKWSYVYFINCSLCYLNLVLVLTGHIVNQNMMYRMTISLIICIFCISYIIYQTSNNLTSIFVHTYVCRFSFYIVPLT